MEEDSIGSRPKRPLRGAILIVGYVAAALLVSGLFGVAPSGDEAGAPTLTAATDSGVLAEAVPWQEIITYQVIAVTLALLCLSAYFSASEIAFFSLHKLTLRGMRESDRAADRLVGQLMTHPGNLLTSILMSNSIVNVLLSVVLATPVEEFFSQSLLLPTVLAYALAVAVTTAVLVFFGEIFPKVLVVQNSQAFARFSAPIIFVIDKTLYPLRDAMILLISGVFRLTGFSKVRPAPFITDDEFVSLLSEGEATGVIEKEEREMIQGIIEYSDLMLREILVPRPDIVYLEDTATVADAIKLYRSEGYSRMPVCHESIDSVVGILYAKDLLPLAENGANDEPILPLVRKVHFVPETMSVASFMKAVQKMRTHLAIVVDEYGGTEGLVTLEDALREVVGDTVDEDEDEEPMIEDLGGGVYRADGGYSLLEFKELTGIELPDEEHTTIAGFLMDQTEKIPAEGDTIVHGGIVFTVEAVDGKRVSTLSFTVPQEADELSTSDKQS